MDIAIKLKYPSTYSIYCIWHISQNLPLHFRSKLGELFEQFKKIQLVFTHNNEFDDINLNENINKWDINLENLLKHEYKHDLWISEIMNVIKNDQQQYKNIILAECEIQNDQLYYKQK